MVCPSTHRSRRLRKKLRIDEFQELGFPVEFRFAHDLSEAQRTMFWDTFLAEAIEANSLMFGGGESGYVCTLGRKSATDLHRSQVQFWLAARPEIHSSSVGLLEDVWHGPSTVEC